MAWVSVWLSTTPPEVMKSTPRLPRVLTIPTFNRTPGTSFVPMTTATDFQPPQTGGGTTSHAIG